jgi:uncharacterized protein DUF4337
MPENGETENEQVRKLVDEEFTRQGGTLLKRIALTTAILAALAAVASLKASGAANEALALKAGATHLQAQASDQWAYYQAKGLKAALAEVARQAWLANNKEPPAQLAESARHYTAEQVELEKQARALERERDTKTFEAEMLLHSHHGFAYAVTLFQVAIALGAVAALTQINAVWIGSLLVGLSGLVLFVDRLIG